MTVEVGCWEYSLKIDATSFIYVGIFIIVVIMATAFYFGQKKNSQDERAQEIKGEVERFGYASRTPKGWGYWVIYLRGYPKAFIMYPHLNDAGLQNVDGKKMKLQDEMALTEKGDTIKIRFHSTHPGKDTSELVVTHFENLSFKLK